MNDELAVLYVVGVYAVDAGVDTGGALVTHSNVAPLVRGCIPTQYHHPI